MSVQTVEMLRARVRGMEETGLRRQLTVHPALEGLVQLRAGASYQVDSATLAFLLMAGPTREGDWAAVVGAGDLGLEAAEELGVDLARTVVVPDPGGRWFEVTAALVDVVSLVVLRPPAEATAGRGDHVASRLAARLRAHETALVAWGEWPRCEARLSLTGSRWEGVGHGDGRLRARRSRVSVRRGFGPERHRMLWLPGEDGQVREDVPRIGPGIGPVVGPVVGTGR